MSKKNPPPPEVGDVFHGPPLGHGSPVMSMRPGLYHVRSVVDVEGEHPDYGWIYHVVFRYFSRRKGWRYSIESSHAIGCGLYMKVNKRKKKAA